MGEKLRWLGRNAEEVVCAAMMVFMTVLGFTNVVARYLGYSMAYTEELLVMLLVWLTMLGTAAGFKRGGDVGQRHDGHYRRGECGEQPGGLHGE